MKILSLLLLLLLLAPVLHAQHEYDRWYFGVRAGIEFAGGGVAARTDGMLQTDEGSAAICDRRTGELLFYTDGVTVWNRDHAVMAGGTALAGHRSSAQSAIIVPVPCSTSLYYIFTTDSEPNLDPPNEGMHYSIVDMERDGGRGEVVTKNRSLLATASERMTATRHANGTDYWVIAHSLGGNTFHAFHLASTGLAALPVNSIVGISQGDPVATETWTMGTMKMSPDGRRLAHTVRRLDLAELFDFDPATGIVSNGVLIPASGDYPWGVSFSPDGSRLYLTGDVSRLLVQYSLLPYDSAAIAASRTTLGDVGNGSDLQIGPDGRIYISRIDQQKLGRIMQPNDRGTAAGYVEQGVDLQGRHSRWVLPSIITGGLQSLDDCELIAMLEPRDPVLCAGGCTEVFDRTVGGAHTWQWSFPGAEPSSHSGRTPPQICYHTPGRYTVRLIVQGETRRDTASVEIVVVAPPVIDAGPDIRLCTDSSATIGTTIGSSEPASYAWSPAAGLSCTDCPSPVASPATGTTYRVTVTTAAGCVAVDSVRVEVGRATALVSIGRDNVGEPGDTLFLPVRLDSPLDAEGVQGITMLLRYDSSVMRMIPRLIRSDSLLMAGWTITLLDEGLGFLRLDCRAPAGRTLRGSGVLFTLPATLFLARLDSSQVAVEMEPIGGTCTELAGSPGLVRVVGCAIDTRLIELFDAKYSFASPEPNPFTGSVEIRFSLALPAHTRVTISDATGEEIVVAVDGELAEGWHTLTWDADRYPAGWYFVTVAAGEWKETRRVLKLE